MIVQDIVPLYLSSEKSQCQETSSPVVLFQSLGLAQSPPLYPGSDFSTRKEAMTPRKIINVLVVRISPLTHRIPIANGTLRSPPPIKVVLHDSLKRKLIRKSANPSRSPTLGLHYTRKISSNTHHPASRIAGRATIPTQPSPRMPCRSKR